MNWNWLIHSAWVESETPLPLEPGGLLATPNSVQYSLPAAPRDSTCARTPPLRIFSRRGMYAIVALPDFCLASRLLNAPRVYG